MPCFCMYISKFKSHPTLFVLLGFFSSWRLHLFTVARVTLQTLPCFSFFPFLLIHTVLSSLPQLQLALCQHSLSPADPQPFTVSSWTNQVWQPPQSPYSPYSLLLFLSVSLSFSTLCCVPIELSVFPVLFFLFPSLFVFYFLFLHSSSYANPEHPSSIPLGSFFPKK